MRSVRKTASAQDVNPAETTGGSSRSKSVLVSHCWTLEKNKQLLMHLQNKLWSTALVLVCVFLSVIVWVCVFMSVRMYVKTHAQSREELLVAV